MSSWTYQYDDFMVLMWYNDIVVVITVLLTNQLHVYNESLPARREMEHSNTILSLVSINSCTIVCPTYMYAGLQQHSSACIFTQIVWL